ncbi:MAG: hypothetical protein HKM87_03985 [Ignavibacteriaceae bacterium]|nr:hypothetical protein [Ignavibacteriaceae bacterium]
MNNDERIIKYLEGELQEDERSLFEKDLSNSETLRNELAAYNKVLTSFDEQKLFDTESTYFTNLVPSIREKLEQRKTINPFRKLGYAAGFLLLFVAGYFIFQPLFSSSENIFTVEEFADNLTDAELNEMIEYYVTEDETELNDEDLSTFIEDDMETIIYSSTYESKLAIISDFELNNFLDDIQEIDEEEIYDELINLNFNSEVNL